MVLLASQSPRRKQLLEMALVPFKTIAQHAPEIINSEISPEENAMNLASLKAQEAKQITHVDSIILAADTLVVLENKILGKPNGYEDAKNMLFSLSGKKHEVITGVCIINPGEPICFYDKTFVTFHSLTHEQIDFYIKKYEPFDKAGAYGVQEWIGAIGIKKIEGDFYNVMGLPVSRVVQHLAQLGVLPTSKNE